MTLTILQRLLEVGLGVFLLAAGGGADEPATPVWPGRFHAMMSQVKAGDRGVVDLWYDYAAGRNLNVIQTQSGEEDGPLFDNERANGTGYYYLPAKAKAKYCNVIDFGVGIIKPDWLAGATYLGEETSGIYDCYKWEQGEIPERHARFLGLGPDTDFADRPALSARAGDANAEGLSLRGDGGSNGALTDGRFMTYWSEKGTDRPVRWVFFDGAEFEVVRFDPGATMFDDLFQIPDYCFEDGDPLPSHGSIVST